MAALPTIQHLSMQTGLNETSGNIQAFHHSFQKPSATKISVHYSYLYEHVPRQQWPKRSNLLIFQT